MGHKQNIGAAGVQGSVVEGEGLVSLTRRRVAVPGADELAIEPRGPAESKTALESEVDAGSWAIEVSTEQVKGIVETVFVDVEDRE